MEWFILLKENLLGMILDFHGLMLKNVIVGKKIYFFFYKYILIRKKMNFTTDLPKKFPLVTYIVASA